MPTLAGLKRALNDGTAKEKYPVGTDLETGDTAKWKVVHYGNASPYNVDKMGAFLVRTRSLSTTTKWNSSYDNGKYAGSLAASALATFSRSLPEEFRNNITSIKVQGQDSTDTLTTKLWVMSAFELYCIAPVSPFYAFDYYKGNLTSPTDGILPRREWIIEGDSSPTLASAWTRTDRTSRVKYSVYGVNGRMNSSDLAYTVSGYLLPACFISND